MSTAPKSNRTTHTCEAVRWQRGHFHSYVCGKPAKIERDGKWYCGIHDPVRVDTKRAERDAEVNRQWAVRTAQRNLEHAAPEMKAALEFILANSGDPVMENVARAALAKAAGK